MIKKIESLFNYFVTIYHVIVQTKEILHIKNNNTKRLINYNKNYFYILIYKSVFLFFSKYGSEKININKMDKESILTSD